MTQARGGSYRTEVRRRGGENEGPCGFISHQRDSGTEGSLVQGFWEMMTTASNPRKASGHTREEIPRRHAAGSLGRLQDASRSSYQSDYKGRSEWRKPSFWQLLRSTRNLMEKRNSAETAHATGRLFQEQKLKSSHLYINKNEGLLLQAGVVTGNYKGGVPKYYALSLSQKEGLKCQKN